jgi:hypothetical protein
MIGNPEAALATIRKELRYIAKVPVYFAQASRTGEVKIGFSTQVHNRLYSLGNLRWSEMTLLGWIPGGPKRERKMHAKFDEFALGAEWFEPAPELLEFAKTSTRHDDPTDVLPKYGRITDRGYDHLVSMERMYLARVAAAA